MKLTTPSFLKSLLIAIAALAASAAPGYSANVTLIWDPCSATIEGYRVFVREGTQNYNYEHPIWEGDPTTCTLVSLDEGATYHFVVRAFAGDLESANSKEVTFVPATDASGDSETDSQVDSGTNDTGTGSSSDDASASTGTDSSDDASASTGTGSTDESSASNGTGSTDDASASADTDSAAGNTAPQAPAIDSIAQTERVQLTPVLVSGDYFDADSDAHYMSQWQIGTDSDFASLVLDVTSQSQLTAYTVGAMVLDVDTVYYWRVRYIDARNAASDWSPTGTFTTIAADASDDANVDGIPDTQAVDESVDVNANGIPDDLEDTIMSVNTVEGQTTVGVETVSDKVSLVAIKSLPATTIADRSVKLGFGLVGFKLYLQDGVKTASVTIHFSKRVPKDAQLYKYATDSGWQVYENAVFANDRMSVTLELEDGGLGDEDGIANGVIVDPSGVGYPDSTASDSTSLTTGTTSDASGNGHGGRCFISAGVDDLGGMGTHASPSVWLVTMMAMMGIIFAGTAVKQ